MSHLGSDAIAGVSLVLPAWMLMVTMSAGGIGGGISSAIARALGAGRRADAQALVLHSLIIGLTLSVIFTVAGLILADDYVGQGRIPRGGGRRIGQLRDGGGQYRQGHGRSLDDCCRLKSRPRTRIWSV